MCKKMNCFLCAWEILALSVLHGTKNPVDPTAAIQVLDHTSAFFEYGEQFDATEVWNIICNAYEDKEAPIGQTSEEKRQYHEVVRQIFLEHKIKIQSTLVCSQCPVSQKRKKKDATDEHYYLFPLKKDTSNLFSGDVFEKQIACELCNYKAGYQNYEDQTDQNPIERVLTRVEVETEIIETSDIIAIKIGRAQQNGLKTDFQVTAETMMFNNIQYRIKAQIEHVDSSSIFSGNYIAYIREFGKTFKFDDEVVTETSHTIFRNKNIIFAVFERYREETPIINLNMFQVNSNPFQIEQKIEKVRSFFTQ